ncbi:MAG: dihydrofolate reductase family protein [Stenotrophobium sp.]
MGKVFVDVGISLDGFMAGPNGRPGNPLGDGGTRIHEWVFPLAAFQERHGQSGGETGANGDLVRAIFARAGAYVMGRRMFDEGEVGWPEHAPFQAPAFVVTHKARKPWVRKGGTTFHFVTDGILSALQQAQKAAGALDVRICGGADLIQQFINAGQVDELSIHVAPILLGKGLRLFDRIAADRVKLEPLSAVHAPQVTHLAFRVGRP